MKWYNKGGVGEKRRVEESLMLMKGIATITGKMYRKSDGALLALCEVRRPNPARSHPLCVEAEY